MCVGGGEDLMILGAANNKVSILCILNFYVYITSRTCSTKLTNFLGSVYNTVLIYFLPINFI